MPPYDMQPSKNHTPANTQAFREWVNARHGLSLSNYEQLRQWSVDHLEDFWQAVWDRFGVHSPTAHARVLQASGMPGARWFEGAQLNYTAHLHQHAAAADAAGVPALLFRNERMQREGHTERWTWAELLRQAGALAATLSDHGVGRGDRVAAYLPNIPQAVVGLLACASLGAVWSLCAPDMGVGTVRDRFAQIGPKVLIACDGAVYGGKVMDRRQVVAELLQTLPTVALWLQVEVMQAAGGQADDLALEPQAWPGRCVAWTEAVAHARPLKPQDLPFDHPLWILYSSGTTGLPKPIVHGHGGVMLEMLKLHALHLNLHPSTEQQERLLWYCSSGWVMWNLSVSALLLGTTVCIYDGHPSYPQPDTLWRLADEMGLTFMGAGAAYYSACLKAGVHPAGQLALSSLRSLGSTGSPLSPQAYAWGFEAVDPDLWWCVICGGTDLASAFLGGTPELPTVLGQMQSRCLGADVQAWDEAGRALHDEVGELVVVQPMPSMPLYFWGDEDQRRYRDSYFDTYPGVWRQGDWLRITPSGGTVVYGRSDATLNRHGHRLGTSELYRVVEDLPEVVDSLVVDLEYLGRPAWMPLFVMLRPGLTLDDALRTRLIQRIRQDLSPRFLPDEIVQVQDIPRTLTGKKQELPVKKLMLGRLLHEVVNPDACANPEAFAWYAQYAQRRLAADAPAQAG